MYSAKNTIKCIVDSALNLKTIKQIAEIKDAYLVKDNIEFGASGIIPIWMLGLLY